MRDCVYCGKPFKRNGRQVYCSRHCREVAQFHRSRRVVTVSCKRCGEEHQRVARPRMSGLCDKCRFRKGAEHHHYKGGIVFLKSVGRWVINCRDGSHVYYYRALVEAKLGRPLRKDEHVHHLNGDKTDDRLENLLLMSHADHARLHLLERQVKAAYERVKAADDAWEAAYLRKVVYGPDA